VRADPSPGLVLTGDLATDSAEALRGLASSVRGLGEATLEIEQADAQYRAWRATATVEQLADGASAEWKVKAQVEALPAFLVHKRRLAEAEAALARARALHDALRAQVNLIRDRVTLATAGLAAAEGDALDPPTRYHAAPPAPPAEARESRAARVRAAMLRGKEAP